MSWRRTPKLSQGNQISQKQKAKQKELTANVLKQRDGREVHCFVRAIPKLAVSSCGALNVKNPSIPVLQTNTH